MVAMIAFLFVGGIAVWNLLDFLRERKIANNPSVVRVVGNVVSSQRTYSMASERNRIQYRPTYAFEYQGRQLHYTPKRNKHIKPHYGDTAIIYFNPYANEMFEENEMQKDMINTIVFSALSLLIAIGGFFVYM
jgi:hypothetical protein